MSQSILLVEGKDDEHVFYALFKYFKVPQAFEIKDKNGISNLLDTLDVELLASDRKHLGIVIDADSDLVARWQSLTTILRKAGYTKIPSSPDPAGTILDHPVQSLPKVGIWIMPDNILPGMLEDFVSFLVPLNDPLWDKASSCLNSLPESEKRFSHIHYAKAHIHTWLAWQEDPGTPLGLAITKKYLDAGSPQAQKFIAWINRLFDSP